MITRAEFLAPLILTFPSREYPPQIFKTEESTWVSDRVLGELISLPPLRFTVIGVRVQF
jgi:hypothetical protein